MNIKFCGAAGTVTGSSHLLTLDDGTKVLLDCGLYQGSDKEFKDFNENWAFNPKEIDFLILSHAHIDHSGRIPKLVKDGFEGEIICTNATRNLAQIMLADSGHIQEREAEFANKRRKEGAPKFEPLYTVKHAEKSMQHFVGIGYDKWHSVNREFSVLFTDAGHILGSACVSLKIRKGNDFIYFGFTGDIGRPERPLLRDPKPMPPMDFLICESTYGNRLHPDKDEEAKALLKIIQETCVDQKGKLLIPAFSIGRTQEIVYLLNKLEEEDKLPKIPVFVDSPLAISATNIFLMHPECFDDATRELMVEDPNPLGFKGLKFTKKVEDSKALNHLKGPAIIISASGMMTAGRIRHHVFNEIENPNNTLLIVGFNAPRTLGRILADGVKKIKLYGKELDVNARVEIMNSFSAHGDQQEMLDFLENQDRKKLKKIFLVHGEEESQEVFKDKLLEKGFKNIIIPELEDSFEL